MTHFYPATVDVHHNDPHFAYEGDDLEQDAIEHECPCDAHDVEDPADVYEVDSRNDYEGGEDRHLDAAYEDRFDGPDMY
jgi:hypothetical protein